jgi:short-subunit dehydrogenase
MPYSASMGKEKILKSETTAPYAPRTVLITGASGGIGAELARTYAAPGRMLILWGRNRQKLADLAAQCCSMGATVETREVDLCDGQAALSAYREDDAASGPDLVILGAGLSDIQAPGSTTESPDKVLQLAQVNYSTPVALATAAAQGMAERGGGRIALFGSVAAFYELPFAASYSSSKAGLAFFAKAAGLGWRQHNIAVTLIAPGFVDTPMSQRLEGPRPFLVSAKKAARLCARAIERRQAVCVFPWPFRVLEVLTRLVPQGLRERILLALAVGQKDAH